MKDGVLTANGTTLGSDNGVAVALMMMVLDDEDIVHPPVECVFTTEEEVGLNGARALDKSQISARTMINMDSEEEGMATISCAGGLRSNVQDQSPGRLLRNTAVDRDLRTQGRDTPERILIKSVRMRSA